MTIRRNIIASLVVLTTIGASPVLADKGHHDKNHKRDKHSQHDNGRHLARGHDKHHKKDDHHARHQHRYKIGDRLSRDRIASLRNPAAYGLEQRRGWEYYSDGQEAYRVDSGTQRVLAVINLINAFSN